MGSKRAKTLELMTALAPLQRGDIVTLRRPTKELLEFIYGFGTDFAEYEEYFMEPEDYIFKIESFDSNDQTYEIIVFVNTDEDDDLIDSFWLSRQFFDVVASV